MTVSPTVAAMLRKGFLGPRPGSNAFPLLQLGKNPDAIFGEDIERLLREGLLTTEPGIGDAPIIKGGDAGPYGEIPDIDLTHRYWLTASGLVAFGDSSSTAKDKP